MNTILQYSVIPSRPRYSEAFKIYGVETARAETIYFGITRHDDRACRLYYIFVPRNRQGWAS